MTLREDGCFEIMISLWSCACACASCALLLVNSGARKKVLVKGRVLVETFYEVLGKPAWSLLVVDPLVCSHWYVVITGINFLQAPQQQREQE